MISLEALCSDPLTVSGRPLVKVVHRRQVMFYLLSPEHYQGLMRNGNKNADPPPVHPCGKFAMYHGWTPDDDFIRQAGLWGIVLTLPLSATELAAFTSYWQAEGKLFHHVQWMQKLARSVQVSRGMSTPKTGGKRDITQISEPDQTVPDGFRG